MSLKPETNYQSRVAQFMEDEKAHAATTIPIGGTDKISSNNPYLKARIQVLEKYPEWRRREIAEMERTGNVNNQHYDAFVHDVAVLGDTLKPI